MTRLLRRLRSRPDTPDETKDPAEEDPMYPLADDRPPRPAYTPVRPTDGATLTPPGWWYTENLILERLADLCRAPGMTPWTAATTTFGEVTR